MPTFRELYGVPVVTSDWSRMEEEPDLEQPQSNTQDIEPIEETRTFQVGDIVRRRPSHLNGRFVIDVAVPTDNFKVISVDEEGDICLAYLNGNPASSTNPDYHWVKLSFELVSTTGRTEEVLNEFDRVKVGDKVLCIENFYSNLKEREGIIREVVTQRSGNKLYVIQFDGWENGHSGSADFNSRNPNIRNCTFGELKKYFKFIKRDKKSKEYEKELEKTLERNAIQLSKTIMKVLKGETDYKQFLEEDYQKIVKSAIEYLECRGYEKKELIKNMEDLR